MQWLSFSLPLGINASSTSTLHAIPLVWNNCKLLFSCTPGHVGWVGVYSQWPPRRMAFSRETTIGLRSLCVSVVQWEKRPRFRVCLSMTMYRHMCMLFLSVTFLFFCFIFVLAIIERSFTKSSSPSVSMTTRLNSFERFGIRKYKQMLRLLPVEWQDWSRYGKKQKRRYLIILEI